MTFYDWFRKAGITHSALAKILKISDSSLSQYLYDKVVPSKITMEKIFFFTDGKVDANSFYGLCKCKLKKPSNYIFRVLKDHIHPWLDNDPIGRWIKIHGKTQKEIAEILSISSSYLSKCRGGAIPSKLIIEKLFYLSHSAIDANLLYGLCKCTIHNPPEYIKKTIGLHLDSFWQHAPVRPIINSYA